MQSLGEKMSDQEMDEMVTEADRERDGLINYERKLHTNNIWVHILNDIRLFF